MLSFNSKQNHQIAFTLLEMSVVLIIMALVIGGGLASFVQWTEKSGNVVTEARLNNLHEAFAEYYSIYGRLPCPADITDDISTRDYGREVGDPGICTAANFQYATDNDVVAGGVPVRTLGITDDMGMDSWGSRILYSVDRRFTAMGAVVLHESAADGKINVNLQGSSTTKNAVYVLVSFGDNKHGAYAYLGGAGRLSGRSATAAWVSGDDYWGWEMENCDCDDGTGASGTFDNDFVQAPYSQDTAKANDYFDDIVSFKTKAHLDNIN